MELVTGMTLHLTYIHQDARGRTNNYHAVRVSRHGGK